MKKNHFSLFVAAVLCFAACSSEPAIFSPSDEPARIRIVPTIATRVTGTHFDEGDQIGVSLYKAGTSLFLDNKCFTYAGSSFTAADARWYSETAQTSTLVAYYPYNATGLPQTFRIQSDQRGDALTRSDLLAACRTDAAPTGEAVALTFRHLLALIDITVTAPASAQIEKIAVKGFTPAATVDLQALTATVSASDPAEITAHEVTANSRYSIVLPPQTATLEVCVYTAEKNLTAKSLANVTLASGKRYTLEVTLSEESLVNNVLLSGEIADWTDGGPIEDTQNRDDSSPSDTPTSGSVLFEGVNYATRTVGDKEWMAANLRYAPSTATPDEDFFYPDSNPANAETLGLLYSCATATGSGICPPGWRLPQISELTTLAATVDRSFFTDSGYFTLQDDRNTYNNSKSYLISATSPSDGKQSYLYIPAETGTIEVKELNNTNIAASVRCVKE